MVHLWILLGVLAFGIGASDGAEYCWESFNATCPSPDQVIFMQTAKYGRMALGKCLTRDYYTGCFADVLSYMDRACSGRHHCEVRVPDTELHKVQPCPKDLMAYMEADYTCVKVAQPPARTRCQQGSPISDSMRRLTAPAGYLASMVTETTGFGSPTCPWRIQLEEGQRINITLYDFASSDHKTADASMCTMYASVKEKGVAGAHMTICGGEQRVKPIYISDTNTIEVQLMPRQAGQQDNPHFVLMYQAIGCGPIDVPEGGWVKRQGDRATVACNATGETWHVVCDGRGWVGTTGNCSVGAHLEYAGGGEKRKAEHKDTLPYGLILAVVIGVVLGIIIGVCLLSVVVGCQRKIRRNKQRSPSTANPQNTNTIDKQRMLRSPEYGYAHVWELQQLQGDDTIKTVDIVPYNHQTGHTHIPCENHKYESPQFLRIDSTIGRGRQVFYPDFDFDSHGHECEAHAHVAPAQGSSNEPPSDEQRYTN